MNLKDKLIELRNKLIKKDEIKEMDSLKESIGEEEKIDLKEFIKDFVNQSDLTEEQFEFLKDLYLQDKKIIGLHNTHYDDVNSFFKKGLTNNTGYLGEKSTSLTNTVYPSTQFFPLLTYHHPRYTTIILLLNEDIIQGKEGIFKDLDNEYYGIPKEYIVGAFQNGKVYKNPNFRKNYKDSSALKTTDKGNYIIRTKEEKEEEVKFCSDIFYMNKDLERLNKKEETIEVQKK